MNHRYKNCVTNISCKVVKFMSHLHTILDTDRLYHYKTLKVFMHFT